MTPSDDPLDVLLVEDNAGDARLIEAYLDRIDPALLPTAVELTHVETLPDAFAALDDSTGLVLLDLGLPGSSGLTTLTRALEEMDDVPVIVLTGLDNTETAVAAIQEGAQDYLNKDALDEDTLGRTIRYAIERTKRERELKARTEQLEVLNRIVRHDISNDIVVIRGLAEELADSESLGDDGRQYLDRIIDASTHIAGLIETTRDFVESIVSEESFDPEPVSLARLLSEEVAKVRSTYDDATVLQGDLPAVQVYADEMLSSVFRNILNNAVQHNDSEHPRVAVAVDAGPETVVVDIADNGPGVPADQREDIFGKGEKGIESSGTGIGLHLVYTLVDRYGGDVWVEDRQHPLAAYADGTDIDASDDPIEGAVFRVELPRV